MSNVLKPISIDVDVRVPLRTKLAWGAGGLADNFMFNLLMALGMLIYVDHFKLAPALAGVALFVPRFVDAITDPWIGNYSDNFVSRFGRRRPFIFIGTVLCSIIMPLLWTPPLVETAINPWYSNAPFLYLCLMGSLLAVSYTLFVVPYTALGFELTPDYDERTRTIAWRMYIGLVGSLSVGWLYKFSEHERFSNVGEGAFWVSVGVSIIVLISGLLPAVACREKVQQQPAAPIKLFKAIKFTLANKPFLILTFSYLIIIVSIFNYLGAFPLLVKHYVMLEDKDAFGSFNGYFWTMVTVVSFCSMFIVRRVAEKTSKRTAMLVGLILIFLGTALNWFALDPRWPMMVFATGVISFLGMQGCWLMVDSMIADVCDADELDTGHRREGMFSAVKGFTLKLAQAISFAVGGFFFAIVGYDATSVETSGLPIEDAVKVKGLVVLTTCVGLIIAAVAMWFYPITRERSIEIHEALEAQKGTREA